VECNYCGQQIPDGQAVTVNTVDITESYCGVPKPTEQMSCWQQVIRGWYWSMDRDPTARREENGEASRPAFRRIAVLAPLRRP